MALKDKYLTISEASKELTVTRQTISRWIKDGKLPAEKIGRETLIEKQDLDIIRKAKVAETFDDAILLGFIHEIRERGKYSKNDEITHIGNLVFDIKKQDGTHDIADVRSFTIEPDEIKIKPKEKFTGKGED